MTPYLVKMPRWITRIYPDLIWHFPTSPNSVYLTFDDGPTPEITPFVLAQLARFNAKATFFCIGKNMVEHPSLFAQIQAEGHSIGNHTYTHVNGKKTSMHAYLEEVKKTKALMPNSALFRPPYGRITRSQTKALNAQGHQIIMWSVLSADFDPKVAPDTCYTNVVNNTKGGDIIVFHDSVKAAKNLRITLPKVLTYLNDKGFQFDAISQK